MYRLWHKLFGWHYFTYNFGGDMEISRVTKAPNGMYLAHMYCTGKVPLSYFRNPIPLTMTMEELQDMIEQKGLV